MSCSSDSLSNSLSECCTGHEKESLGTVGQDVMEGGEEEKGEET